MKQNKLKGIFLHTVFAFFIASAIYAQSSDIKVTSVDVNGNSRVSLAKITSKIKTRVNAVYNPNVVSDDIKRLYSLGFFERVWVDQEKKEDGIKIIFRVTEKPLLKELTFEGNRKIHKTRLEKETELKKGVFMDERKAKIAVDKVKALYIKKGFSSVIIKTEMVTDEEIYEVSYQKAFTS